MTDSVAAISLLPPRNDLAQTTVTINGKPQPSPWTNEMIAMGGGRFALLIGPDCETLMQTDDGDNWLVLQEFDENFQAFTKYDPPLLLLPAELAAGKPVEQAGRVTVHRPITGDIMHTGSYHTTHRLLGRSTHDGHNVVLVESDRTLKLPLASVSFWTRTAYDPDIGPLHWTFHRTIRVLGLIPIEHQYTLNRLPQKQGR